MAGEDHTRKAAAFRGKRDFEAAIAVIEDNRASFDEITIVPALLEAFYAAVEGELSDKARELAKELAALAPELPSIQRFL